MIFHVGLVRLSVMVAVDFIWESLILLRYIQIEEIVKKRNVSVILVYSKQGELNEGIWSLESSSIPLRYRPVHF